MATTLTIPTVIGQPFANTGDKGTIPESTSSLGVASLAAGFPVECSKAIGAGGAYPRRSDMNALGNLATSLNFFMQNGGTYTFDADVSNAIGGYPAGAKLWATVNGGSAMVESLKDNNEDDFVSTPAFIGNGTSWQICFWTSATSGTAENSLLATSGFQKLPSGLIVQWGTQQCTDGAGTLAITFPVAFPNGCFLVIPAVRIAASATNKDIGLQTISKSVSGAVLCKQIFEGGSTFSTADYADYFAIGY